MFAVRRAILAIAFVMTSLGSAVAASLLTATPGAALASCTDLWQGPTSGTQSWSTAADWSTGVPASTSVVCINLSGTYVVDLTSSTTINTLELGGSSGTQTLEISGASGNNALTLAASSTSMVGSQGVLALDPATGYADVAGPSTAVLNNVGTLSSAASVGSSPAYIEIPLVNQSGGTVTLGAPSTDQDQGTPTSNSGTFSVSSGANLALTGGSTFTDGAGTLTLTGTMNEGGGTFTQSGGTESGNPVVLGGGALLADSAGTGGFDVTGSSTLSGTIPSGQTVTVDGSAANVDVSLPGAVGDDGSLALKAGTGFAEITGSGGVTVASTGSLTTSGGAGSSPAFLETPVTNEAGGTVTLGAHATDQDDGTLTSNSGTFTVSSGANLALSGGSTFTDGAGTLTLTGTMNEGGGTFTQSGGTQSGNPVVLGGGAFLADAAGTGGFDVTSSSTLSGTIPSGQTVTVDGSAANVQLALPSAVTDDGTLALKAATGYADVTGVGGVTVNSGGVLSSSGGTGSSPAYFETPVTNEAGGTVTLGAHATDQDDGTLTSNSGTFTVSSGANLALTGGSTFTDGAGTLTLTGTMNEGGGTFTQSGGTESGNPVVLGGGALLADAAGTGGFDVTSSSTLSGTIPSGQTVTVDGSAANVQLALPSAVTDDGTLALKAATGYADVTGAGGLTVGSGGVLSSSGGAGSSPAYLETPVTNQAGGSVILGAHATDQDDGTLTSNSGTVQVVNGGQLILNNGSTLTTGAAATLGVTVNGTASTGGISGPGLSLAGTLAVTTVGSPAVNTIFTPITGPVTGTFAAFSFGPAAYGVSYPANAVVLTTKAPFTVGPTSFSPKENVPTGTVQVASIGSAANGTGTYSATVNFGDGSPLASGTVSVSGSTGTVTAPSHTYPSAGIFTETTTVANSDGTTLVAAQSVTVTGPTIIKFSKTSIKQGKTLTTVVTGTGFAAGAVVTTSNSGVTVVSAKLSKVTHKHPTPTVKLKLKASRTAALGPFSVTITEPSGATTDSGAITVVAG